MPRARRPTRATAANNAEKEQLDRELSEVTDSANRLLQRKDSPSNHELRESLRDLTECIHKAPAHAMCYFYRAQIYIRLNEPKLALFDLTMAIQMVIAILQF